MATQDRIVSLHPYFRVADGKLDLFRKLCEQFMAATATEPDCVYYAFSFDGNDVHCREAYDDAAALLLHLDNVGTVFAEALKISELSRLEVHGPAEELAKLQEALAALNPTYFRLEYGFRR
jgi:quinol monooxygenase YgiN